jgi:hypothetical protein
VDAIYNLSEALPRRSVIINSATGSVSEVGLLDPNGPPNKRQVIKGPKSDQTLHHIVYM